MKSIRIKDEQFVDDDFAYFSLVSIYHVNIKHPFDIHVYNSNATSNNMCNQRLLNVQRYSI